MAAPEQLSEIELRGMLDKAIEETLELADELAASVAAGGSHVVMSQIAANYMQARQLVRTLKRALLAEVGA